MLPLIVPAAHKPEYASAPDFILFLLRDELALMEEEVGPYAAMVISTSQDLSYMAHSGVITSAASLKPAGIFILERVRNLAWQLTIQTYGEVVSFVNTFNFDSPQLADTAASFINFCQEDLKNNLAQRTT